MSSSFLSRQPESPAAEDGLTFESRQPVPTVRVKRSRLAGLGTPPAPSAGMADASSATARDPKVFRVAAPVAALPPAAASPAMGEVAAPATPSRRKRDPLRAPRLLRHEVLALPPAPPQPPAAADYGAVCAALEGLRRDLALARQASRFRLPLL